MTYDARQIANWFAARFQQDGKPLSIMSLLKLTYIAHGWQLEMRDEPLFTNRIEAWKYGPVIPDVYEAFRNQGVNVTRAVEAPPVTFSDDDNNFLEQIYKIYSPLSAYKLSDLTHVSGGPWDIATKTGGYYAPIPNELIKQHYVRKRADISLTSANG